MVGDNYSERVSAEIANFDKALAVGGVTTSIPKSFTYWASKYLSPRLINIFGSAQIENIFASEILKCKKKDCEELSVLSLGSGDCVFEKGVHEIINSQVHASWTCTDLNPSVSAYASQLVDKGGFADNFKFHTLDLNNEFVTDKYDVILVNHALHHFVNLEFILDSVRESLNVGGRFVVSDMIGRNGHMRWQESLTIIESLWKVLPDNYRFNNHAKCFEGRTYNNYDCTTGGDFEGVRAQDILPLLLERFNFIKFVGFGNLPDIFVDRAYGPNFDCERDFDKYFIDFLEDLNCYLIDRGVIKPTMMIATLANDNIPCQFDRWSPQFSLRVPD
ncbi:MAG: class I SAM-dependent methyltransferase [Ktedonobacteraceae bacterium]